MATINPFDFFLEPEAETLPFAYDPVLEQELAPFRRLDRARARCCEALLAEVPRERAAHRRHAGGAQPRWCRRAIAYIVRMEPGVWTPEETLARRQGLLPRLGLAAGAAAAPSRLRRALRLRLPDPAGGRTRSRVDGPEGPTADFTDLHAWAEVYLPGAGWIGLDATSGLMTGEGHIPLAATPEPQSAAPITGAAGEGRDRIRLRDGGRAASRETPRVTKPYTDDAVGTRSARAGRAVDAGCRPPGMRLTMGGEPTFVAATDRDAAGMEHRRARPDQARLCRAAAAPAGRRCGRRAPRCSTRMGKQYPGEQLPRWALYCALARGWRAGLDRPGAAGLRRRHGRRDARRMPRASPRCWPSGCRSTRRWCRAAHEDIHYYLWRNSACRPTWWSRTRSSRTRWSASASRRVFGQGLARRGRRRCCRCAA